MKNFKASDEKDHIRITRRNPAPGYFFDILSKEDARELYEELKKALKETDK